LIGLIDNDNFVEHEIVWFKFDIETLDLSGNQGYFLSVGPESKVGHTNGNSAWSQARERVIAQCSCSSTDSRTIDNNINGYKRFTVLSIANITVHGCFVW